MVDNAEYRPSCVQRLPESVILGTSIEREFFKVWPAAAFEALPLQWLVVVFVDGLLGGVRPVGGHLTRDAAVAVPGDRAGSDLVGRSR